MRFLSTLVVALTLLISTATASTTRQTVVHFRGGIAWHRAKTWSLQDALGVSRTRTEHAERRTTSVPYLRWMNSLWRSRQKHARLRLYARLPMTNDWQTAVRIVQRSWPGTSSWLLSCSAAEGGHGGFVMNHQGSGAGGWLQYMQSTFDYHYSSALSLARHEHRALPPAGLGWTSPLAQAFAGGWGYSYQRAAWTGDPACA